MNNVNQRVHYKKGKSDLDWVTMVRSNA